MLTHVEFVLDQSMLVRKAQSKRKSATGTSAVIPLDSSLTSIEWLPNMQIGEGSAASAAVTPTAMVPAPVTTTAASTSLPTVPVKQSLPVTTSFPQKMEAVEVEMPTTTVNDNAHAKPPYSYVTLIRQAIQSTRMQRMTLNEIYQWIVESYPYFRAAPPKWKVRGISTSELAVVTHATLVAEFHSAQSLVE